MRVLFFMLLIYIVNGKQYLRNETVYFLNNGLAGCDKCRDECVKIFADRFCRKCQRECGI